MLSHERNKSKAMDEELVGLRKQVESLKSQARPSLSLSLRVCVCVYFSCLLALSCAHVVSQHNTTQQQQRAVLGGRRDAY